MYAACYSVSKKQLQSPAQLSSCSPATGCSCVRRNISKPMEPPESILAPSIANGPASSRTGHSRRRLRAALPKTFLLYDSVDKHVFGAACVQHCNKVRGQEVVSWSVTLFVALRQSVMIDRSMYVYTCLNSQSNAVEGLP